MNLFTFAEIAQATGGQWRNVIPDPNAGVAAVQTNSQKPLAAGLFVPLRGERFDGHRFLGEAATKGAAALCAETAWLETAPPPPNIPVLAVADTLKAYQALGRARRLKMKDLTVIGLTGSSGKTSSKEILRAILASAFGEDRVYATAGNTNNQVGVPQNLMEMNDNARYAVIEMGTNHFGEIDAIAATAIPDLAMIVSIGPAHLEFFGDTDGVAKEKSTIFNHLRDKSRGWAVIPKGGPGVSVLREATAALRTFTFGAEADADVRFDYAGGNLEGSRFTLRARGASAQVDWELKGAHQASNAAAAAAIGLALGLDLETIAKGLRAARLPGMRARVRQIHGVTLINDAYNANPDSVMAGLRWLAEFAGTYRRTVLVLGDMLEMGAGGAAAHREILAFAAERLPNADIRAVGPIMSQIVLQEKPRRVTAYPNAAEAAKALKEHFRDGDLVFLKGSRGIGLEAIENTFAE